MDSSSMLEESKISSKYSGLDESLRFVQSLVFNGFKKEESLEQETSQLQRDEDMVLEDNAPMDVDEPHDELNQSGISSHYSQNSQLNVEDRLNMMNDMYKKRREEKLKAAQQEEMKNTKVSKPIFNKKSQQILKDKIDINISVEERLLSYGKKKQKQEEISKSNSEGSATGTKSKPKKTAVVSRLMDYGQLYKQKKAEREEQVQRKQTFKPNIEKSNTLLNVRSRYNIQKQSTQVEHHEHNDLIRYTTESNADSSRHSISANMDSRAEDRLYDNSAFKEPSKKMMKIQDEYDKNHPFMPKINEMSKAIIEQKRTHGEGPPVPVRKQKDDENNGFKPVLNKNSEEIIRLMKEGQDYDQKNRWKSLYEYGVMKQKGRKEIEAQIKQAREQAEVESQPYKPQILHYEKPQDESSKSVIDRTKEWAASLECKKEVLAESYYQNEYIKELNECTFKPRLIAEEKLKELNMTVSEFSSKIDVSVNPKSLESFYRRMEEAHYRKKEKEEYEDNFCGSGKNWENKLTLPTIPDFHEKNVVSLDQVKSITKAVVRDGEIVKDPIFKINRHENYKMSDLTTRLRDEEKNHQFEAIHEKNQKFKETLFDEQVEFDD
jgi:hypothetical protein